MCRNKNLKKRIEELSKKIARVNGRLDPTISCNNPYLKDLSGGDCGWSCWKRISPTET